MKLIKFSNCTETSAKAESLILSRLTRQLDSNKQVLWLVSGGSVITLASSIAKRLAKHAHAKNLTVGLIDERYGSVGHENSNWQQLKEAKFLFEKFATLPVLTGKTQEETALEYENSLKAILSRVDYSIGLYGMGADGHTSGMLPTQTEDEFAKFMGRRLVIYYKGPDYQRVTTTAGLIPKLDSVVLFACGESKKEQIEKLERGLPAHIQPAQLLKTAKKFEIFYGVQS